MIRRMFFRSLVALPTSAVVGGGVPPQRTPDRFENEKWKFFWRDYQSSVSGTAEVGFWLAERKAPTNQRVDRDGTAFVGDTPRFDSASYDFAYSTTGGMVGFYNRGEC